MPALPLRMQSENLIDLVAAVLAKAPAWVRLDLAGEDRVTRERAEETLAAMISAAIEDRG